ncbi:MAG: VanZ family protein [Desulfobacterales bacterium]|nr:VanZ family protein [Deltaproteobacteria bacterium]NNK94437.1 VanZ family protein [Desulfobacterales bacterium]
MFNRWFRPNTCLALGYALSAVLVLVYVNMFPLWKLLSDRWGREVFVILPIVLSLGSIIVVGIIFSGRQQKARSTVKKSVLIAGLVFCAIALVIPDPQFPVKRIHVAEYVLLSLVVRFAMSFKLQGAALLFFSAGFASVLGVHEELLQGWHPSRTYGLRDITVNTFASFGGAIIWHELKIFSWGKPLFDKQTLPSKNCSSVYLVWLIASVVVFILPLVLFRGSTIPYWPAMPLIGTIVYFSLYKDQFITSWKHGMAALSVVSFALILYPIINNVNALLFF